LTTKPQNLRLLGVIAALETLVAATGNARTRQVFFAAAESKA
jgi:hypothetical protein